jgi:hypothetical protein
MICVSCAGDDEGDTVDDDWIDTLHQRFAVERALHVCCRAGAVDRLVALCKRDTEQVLSKAVDVLLAEMGDADSTTTRSCVRRCGAALIPILARLNRARELRALANRGVGGECFAFDEALLSDALYEDHIGVVLALLEFHNAPPAADRVFLLLFGAGDRMTRLHF